MIILLLIILSGDPSKDIHGSIERYFLCETISVGYFNSEDAIQHCRELSVKIIKEDKIGRKLTCEFNREHRITILVKIISSKAIAYVEADPRPPKVEKKEPEVKEAEEEDENG